MSEYIEHDQEGVSVGLVEKRFFTFAEPPHEMLLESGARLGPITLAYETCGELNRGKATPSSSSTPSRATPMWPAITPRLMPSRAGGTSWWVRARGSTPTATS